MEVIYHGQDCRKLKTAMCQIFARKLKLSCKIIWELPCMQKSELFRNESKHFLKVTTRTSTPGNFSIRFALPAKANERIFRNTKRDYYWKKDLGNHSSWASPSEASTERCHKPHTVFQVSSRPRLAPISSFFRPKFKICKRQSFLPTVNLHTYKTTEEFSLQGRSTWCTRMRLFRRRHRILVFSTNFERNRYHLECWRKRNLRSKYKNLFRRKDIMLYA